MVDITAALKPEDEDSSGTGVREGCAGGVRIAIFRVAAKRMSSSQSLPHETILRDAHARRLKLRFGF